MNIKKFFTTLLCMTLFVSFSFASTRGDVKIIEATENIQYLSQKIAIDYFFYYHKQKDSMSQRKLDENIKKLEVNISEIINTTKNEHTKDILNYFTYRLEEIKILSKEQVNKANARRLLDHSEGFLEGAEAIIEEHKYKFSKEEEMLMLSKKAQYLLERVITYYMASKIGLNSAYKQQKMKNAIRDIDKVMTKINAYQYSIALRKKVDKFSNIWGMNREFFTNMNKTSIPYLLLGSTQYTKKIMVDIEQYHKKNL